MLNFQTKDLNIFKDNIEKDKSFSTKEQKVNLQKKDNENNIILENIAFNIMSFIDKECVIDIENSMHEEYIKQVIKSPNMIDKLYLLCYTT